MLGNFSRGRSSVSGGFRLSARHSRRDSWVRERFSYVNCRAASSRCSFLIHPLPKPSALAALLRRRTSFCMSSRPEACCWHFSSKRPSLHYCIVLASMLNIYAVVASSQPAPLAPNHQFNSLTPFVIHARSRSVSNRSIVKIFERSRLRSHVMLTTAALPTPCFQEHTPGRPIVGDGWLSTYLVYVPRRLTRKGSRGCQV
ncbi:hypothetical protein OH77DRAFT_1422264 [Trametes cingulata]|nr:hypothetical protein OH77DRAFT_1422264 [Trametes cingulata]